jgi:hypothetical protein
MNRLEERVADQLNEKALKAVEAGIKKAFPMERRDVDADFYADYDNMIHLEARAALRAHLAFLEAQGLKIVPVEPTEAMLEAGAIPLRRPGPTMDIAPSLEHVLAQTAYAAMLNAVEG